MGDASDTTRTTDEAILRYLVRVLAAQHEVRGTSLFPANKQETLVVSLDTEYYPESIEEVWLEPRVYTNGDVHVSYVENYVGEVRRCRWDRHDRDHNTRDHFHPFPTASTTGAEDRDFPADVTALLATIVLPGVENRLGTLWEESAPHD